MLNEIPKVINNAAGGADNVTTRGESVAKPWIHGATHNATTEYWNGQSRFNLFKFSSSLHEWDLCDWMQIEKVWRTCGIEIKQNETHQKL